jgi:hypothetical protein
MSKRRKIKKITIEIDGLPARIIDIDAGGELPEAIFFGDTAVKEILTPYYDGKDKKIKKKDVKTYWFPEILDKVFGAGAPDDKEKKVDKKVIDDIWDTEDAEGETLALLLKRPYCALE